MVRRLHIELSDFIRAPRQSTNCTMGLRLVHRVLRSLPVLILLGFIMIHLDARAQEWRITTEIPSFRVGAAAAAVDGNVYLIGGRTREARATRTILLYDPSTNRWSDDVPPMHVARINAAVVVVGKKIFVIGGRNAEGEVLRSVEVYTPGSERWEEFPEIRRQREGAAAVLLRGQMFVLGGSDQNERALETVEVFNVIEERWDEVGEWKLDAPRVSSGVAVVDHTFYIFGGFNVFGPVSQVLSYDTDTAVARSVDMPVARGGLAAIPVGKNIHVIGGRSRDAVLNTMSLYRPHENSWSELAPMKIARFNFASVRVADAIYVFGGFGPEQRPLASVEAYGPLGIATEEPPQPEDFGLQSAFPNPFFDEIALEINVSRTLAAPARVDIYDATGRLVRTLASDLRPSGTHRLTWDGTSSDGRRVAAGLYVGRLSQGSHVAVQKLVLVR